ncbi:MAG: hypothetical protein C4532_04630 [Candidatus Abyssobacteria bacterium SURF_17]|uniref:Uncharacterized protein n=1 Tax=Candidatus Abyssobacteria bacterium SURF_17 TaxID=2093361 RepID=A0A419F519_9BACT|nr:MAG: hypothetical protein C4532_04630 [Candidatus Abyssubacteria bacterium SURF_17]
MGDYAQGREEQILPGITGKSRDERITVRTFACDGTPCAIHRKKEHIGLNEDCRRRSSEYSPTEKASFRAPLLIIMK